MKVVILMGSKSDSDFCKEIGGALKSFGVRYEYRVASAHKHPEKVLQITKEYQDVIFITVAGRSNALSGFVDANTLCPVIACPPYSEKFAGVDIFSSLRVPSGVGCVTIIEPKGAALAAAKIIALQDAEVKAKVEELQKKSKKEIDVADEEVKKWEV